eukprot:3509177-Pleurochrysis_carterae.AAC.1
MKSMDVKDACSKNAMEQQTLKAACKTTRDTALLSVLQQNDWPSSKCQALWRMAHIKSVPKSIADA